MDEGTTRLETFSDGVFAIAATSPLAAVVLTFAIAAFYLPSAALFDR